MGGFGPRKAAPKQVPLAFPDSTSHLPGAGWDPSRNHRVTGQRRQGIGTGISGRPEFEKRSQDKNKKQNQ